MPRRIDVELTSRREDGTWTWRAAGARQPKGELDGSLLYDGASVGDVVKAEADFDIDGITILGVTPPKGQRREPERIELVGTPMSDDQLVTSTLVGKGGGRGGRRDDREGRERRGPRSNRGGGPRSDRSGDRRPRRDGAGGERSGAPRRERAPRPERPAPEPRPKAKRLRPGRTHRNEVLASLPDEQKPIAEAVLRGGIPAVRQAVDKQNEEARASGAPEIKADGMVSIGEQLLPALRTAEWHDRADAALADVDELDLRDLRSVVVAADVAARDETTRELAQNLRDALARRVEQEHAAWLAEVTETLGDGRTVRALRLSSRPPKAGSPLPPELAARLTEAANAALTADTGPDRYATVLDALAYSPVRQAVVPQGVPAEPGDALLAAVRKMSSRLPQIAALFGIEASAAKPPRGPRSGPRKGGAKAGGKGGPKPVPAPPDLTATTPAEGAASTPTPTEATPEATPAIEAAPAAEPIEAAPVPEAIEAAPVAEAIEAAPVPEAIEAAPVPEAIEAAPMPEPTAEATPAVTPIDDAAAADNPDVIEQSQSTETEPDELPAPQPAPTSGPIDDAAAADNPDVIEQQQDSGPDEEV